MPDPTAPDRTPGSAVRRPRALERLVVVGVIAAVLVAVAAWIAMNRPDGTAEAAAASAAASGSGSFSETSGTPADGTAAEGATPADPSSSAAAGATAGSAGGVGATGGSAPAAGGSGSSGGSGSGSGTGGSGAARTTASGGSSGSGPLSPTTAFLTQLAASGLGPPVDDTQKLAMADDVCQELKNGSKYADVVRALTFAGASDEQAANFAKLAITNLCPKFPIG